ncbi:calcium-binding protein [Novosphingobium sediminis]|nr:calcium-binding protein [Novosphingobium sediminis]
MVGTTSFSYNIDRTSGVFDVSVDYTIPGYNDPETGEQFYETMWSFSYSGSDGYFGYSGYGWDSGYGYISIGLAGDTIADGRLDFYAVNGFSGEEARDSIHILNAALATKSVTLSAAPADGTVIMLGGAAADVLTGADGNDLLDAGDGADTLVAGAGNDTLNGGSGADKMTGGAGDDIYYVDDAGDKIVEVSGGGHDLVFAAISTTLAAEVEDLILWANGPLNGSGNALANALYGNNQTNTLSGQGGDDVLFGYDGDDTLNGGFGNDRLDGGRGNDSMAGGTGDDHYVIDSAGDRIIEGQNEGTDEARIDGLASYTLGSGVENLTNLVALPTFTGKGNALANVLSGAAGVDYLHGFAGADRLVGGDGNDMLEGGSGADQLVGGNGIDIASYATATAAVSVNLATQSGTGDAAGDTFDSIENITGSRFDDILTGNAANNYISGGAGNDTLIGGGGLDWFLGGLGADKLNGTGDDGASYRGSASAVTVNLATLTARGGDADGDVLVGISQVEGTALADTLTGNNGNNVLIGGGDADKLDGAGGNDLIRGGAGGDIMIGGAGTDTLEYTSSAAAVTVDLGTGSASGGDATGDSFSGFENLAGSAFGDTLKAGATGSTLLGGGGDDTLIGGVGADRIIGGAGGDTMHGGGGIDTLSYETSTGNVTIDLASGFAYGDDAFGDSFTGFENLRGGSASDTLYGNAGINVITGGDGGDYIDGRGGNDVIYGGAGDEAFALGPDSGMDHIRDFTAGGTEDRLVIYWDSRFDTFAEVMAAATQQGADTVITLSAGIGVVLEGVSKASLTAADFVF